MEQFKKLVRKNERIYLFFRYMKRIVTFGPKRAEAFRKAEKARKECISNGITEDAAVESMYFISTLPWLDYSSLIQPVAGGDESNPRITWGKYEENASGRVVMPVSILAHHALADGVQLAGFYENLGRELQMYRGYL